MTKTERHYSERLELMKAAGEILDWSYEPEALRLAKATTYTPDFRVIGADGVIEFHEVKSSAGYQAMNQAASRVKIKVAAELHWMYRFVVAIAGKRGAAWKLEYIEPR